MGFTRRSFLTATAFGAAGLALAACAPKATEAPAEAGQAEKPAEQAAEPASKEKILIKYHIFWNQPQVWEEPFRATAEWKAMEDSGLEIWAMWPVRGATRLARQRPWARPAGSTATKLASAAKWPQPGYCTMFCRKRRAPRDERYWSLISLSTWPE